MTTEQLYEELQGLNNLIYQINKRQPEAIQKLNRLNRMIYGETVTAGCSNCHIKAFNKLTSLTIEDLEIMENQNFKLKKGVLLEYPHMSGQFYSSVRGIDDKTATAYLEQFPKKLTSFEKYPGSDSESKELDLSAIEAEPAGKDLSKMNKADLQTEYEKVKGEKPDDSLTKAELIKAIEAEPAE